MGKVSHRCMGCSNGELFLAIKPCPHTWLTRTDVLSCEASKCQDFIHTRTNLFNLCIIICTVRYKFCWMHWQIKAIWPRFLYKTLGDYLHVCFNIRLGQSYPIIQSGSFSAGIDKCCKTFYCNVKKCLQLFCLFATGRKKLFKIVIKFCSNHLFRMVH